MKNSLATIFCLLFLTSLVAPAAACVGCGGRFPAGVNLRLMRMRMQRDPDQRTQAPPASKGSAIPMKSPAKNSQAKAKSKAGKTTNSKASKSSKP